MRIKVRITILMISSALLLTAVFFFLNWMRDQQWELGTEQLLMRTLNIAWKKSSDDAFSEINQIKNQVLDNAIQEAICKSNNSDDLISRFKSVTNNQPIWQAEILDESGFVKLATTNNSDFYSITPPSIVQKVLHSSLGELRYFGQSDRRKYSWIIATRIRCKSNTYKVLTIALEAHPRLKNLADGLASSVLIMNLEGKEVVSTVPGLFSKMKTLIPIRRNSVIETKYKHITYKLVSQPLYDPDSRAIGVLVWFSDITSQTRRNFNMTLIEFFLALTFTTVLTIILYRYLRHALDPLGRSVEVLNALAIGNFQKAIDEDDEETEDEAGSIAKGVAHLRNEMLNLQILRDERLRSAQQQSRLIREQLRLLAESLDSQSQKEVVQSLDSLKGNSANNQLVDLATVLTRMSGLVTNQHRKLISLLNELKQAMETKALFASLQQELEIGRQMQLSILPVEVPNVKEVDIASVIIPAREIGGDFYDYFLLDNNHLGIVIADVSGKGVPAAFFMAIARSLLKNIASYTSDVASTVKQLNDLLCQDNNQMMFVTVFYAVLTIDSGVLEYVNAGHNPPVFISKNKLPHFLPAQGNLALAVESDQSYQSSSITLSAGDIIFLYTDGVTEASRQDGMLFGEERLIEELELSRLTKEISLDHINENLIKKLRVFEDGAHQADDITCLILKYTGLH